ncbi:MAG: methyltransferase domain-containing protein [Tepidisphaera sp.]|nr:methyltransferase domain-containing protein [Tepidisphaera sp.]
MEVPKPTHPTIDGNYSRDWPAYFAAVANQPPRDTLLRALDALAATEFAGDATPESWAIDIACGEGRDTRAMLARFRGWRVLALDASEQGLALLTRGLAATDVARVVTQACPMERVATTHASLGRERRVALINASFALPFCEPGAFEQLWAWVWATLSPGGCFAGQLFGDRDEWATIDPRRHRSRAQVERLLEGVEVVHLEEAEKDGPDAMGGTKHHHVFHIVARKPRGEMPRH